MLKTGEIRVCAVLKICLRCKCNWLQMTASRELSAVERVWMAPHLCVRSSGSVAQWPLEGQTHPHSQVEGLVGTSSSPPFLQPKSWNMLIKSWNLAVAPRNNMGAYINSVAWIYRAGSGNTREHASTLTPIDASVDTNTV